MAIFGMTALAWLGAVVLLGPVALLIIFFSPGEILFIVALVIGAFSLGWCQSERPINKGELIRRGLLNRVVDSSVIIR